MKVLFLFCVVILVILVLYTTQLKESAIFKLLKKLSAQQTGLSAHELAEIKQILELICDMPTIIEYDITGSSWTLYQLNRSLSTTSDGFEAKVIIEQFIPNI